MCIIEQYNKKLNTSEFYAGYDTSKKLFINWSKSKKFAIKLSKQTANSIIDYLLRRQDPSLHYLYRLIEYN